MYIFPLIVPNHSLILMFLHYSKLSSENHFCLYIVFQILPYAFYLYGAITPTNLLICFIIKNPPLM